MAGQPAEHKNSVGGRPEILVGPGIAKAGRPTVPNESVGSRPVMRKTPCFDL